MERIMERGEGMKYAARLFLLQLVNSGLTVNEITKGFGVSRSTAYYYKHNRAEIARSMVLR